MSVLPVVTGGILIMAHAFNVMTVTVLNVVGKELENAQPVMPITLLTPQLINVWPVGTVNIPMTA